VLLPQATAGTTYDRFPPRVSRSSKSGSKVGARGGRVGEVLADARVPSGVPFGASAPVESRGSCGSCESGESLPESLKERLLCRAPTSTSRNEQEKWCGVQRDRNFKIARVDSSALELESLQPTGRVMPNECWLPCEAPLTESEVVPHTVTESSIEQGPERRDPRRTIYCSRHHTTNRHGRRPQRASAMGSSVGTSRRSRGHDGTIQRPVGHATSVAPFGVSAIMRLAHVNGAREASRGDTYEVQETDGVDPSSFRAPQATVGDGCPGVVTMKTAARSSQRGNG